MVLTQVESVTLVLVDWLIKGHESGHWGEGYPPPLTLSWIPSRFRDISYTDLKTTRADLVKRAEALSKSPASGTSYSFWSGVLVPPGVKKVVSAKHNISVSVS